MQLSYRPQERSGIRAVDLQECCSTRSIDTKKSNVTKKTCGKSGTTRMRRRVARADNLNTGKPDEASVAIWPKPPEAIQLNQLAEKVHSALRAVLIWPAEIDFVDKNSKAPG